MSRYKRRIIYTSVAIHVFALTGIFLYWLLNPDLEIPQKAAASKAPQQVTGQNQAPKKQKTGPPNKYKKKGRPKPSRPGVFKPGRGR